MYRTALALMTATLAVGCGPSYGGQGAKSPDEIIDEQERLGAQQQKEAAQHDYSGPVGETDLEKKKKWDQAQAELELKRAQRSAETCPSSVPEEAPKGKATVTLKFGNDGHVKESSITSPYDENTVGKCVLRAMTAVIVPAYVGEEQSLEWEVDLTHGKEAPAKETTKPKKK
jgi:hypothetical protein